MDEIKQRIIELVSDIKTSHTFYCSEMETCTGHGELRTRPITLADVLRALSKRTGDDGGRIWIDEDGRIMRGAWTTDILWNLSHDFDSQTPEVKAFIGELLGIPAKGERV